MRIIQYLKKSKLAVVLIMLLLCVQAYADLSLPRYTSDLVDVGIQQGGIEDAVPSQLTAETFTYLASELSGSQAQLLESSYAQDEGGNYELTDYGQQNRTQLDSAIELPLASKYFSGAVQESLVSQQAIAAVKLEYRALGMDEGSVQISYLLNIGLRMLGVTALMVVASVLVGLIASRTAAGIAANLRERLFARVVSFSDAEVQSFSAASLITRGTNDITQIQTTIVMLLRMVLYSPILAIGGIVMVAQTNVEMSWIIVLAVVVLAIVIAILMALALPKFRIMQKLIDRVNLVAREMLSGLQVVRAFGRQQHEEQRFNDASHALYKTQLFTNRTMSFMMPAMMLVMNATSVLIVWAGGHAINAGTMQTGDMIAFITYSMVIVMSFLMIGMIAIMLPRADVSAQRVNEVLACESSIKDPAQSHAAELAANAQGLPVQFKNVTFTYNQGSEPVLRDISFTAQPGQTTAIIGATGSGKTTILKLIERFYDVTQGQVLVGGVDVRELNQHELRQNIGYVPQKAFLFSGSIAETISYGAEGAPEEELRRAASIAQATEFIDSKEEGMQSPLSQGGTNVSGGQRQRLSIARALATDAPVLLFDDGFSALDYKTDAKLRTALAEEAGGKTVIVVAQRISTVLNADQILVLDGGGLVGCGTHSQLLETCRTYREIAESQLSEQELKGGVAQ
jgi:ATP-binding cassette, subfamily B, multidrug efflux pump